MARNNWLLPRSARLVREIPMADSQHCQRALNDLEKSVDERLGIEGPGFSAAKESLDGVIRTLSRRPLTHAHIEPHTLIGQTASLHVSLSDGTRTTFTGLINHPLRRIKRRQRRRQQHSINCLWFA